MTLAEINAVILRGMAVKGTPLPPPEIMHLIINEPKRAISVSLVGVGFENGVLQFARRGELKHEDIYVTAANVRRVVGGEEPMFFIDNAVVRDA